MLLNYNASSHLDILPITFLKQIYIKLYNIHRIHLLLLFKTFGNFLFGRNLFRRSVDYENENVEITKVYFASISRNEHVETFNTLRNSITKVFRCYR